RPSVYWRAERPAGKDAKRRNDLHEGRGSYPRRFFAADQYRAEQRTARRADEHLQDRERLDAEHRGQREGDARPIFVFVARRIEDNAVLRSIAVCAGRSAGRVARSIDRSLPDGGDDSAFSRQLEEHADHRDFDSTFDSGERALPQRTG